MSGKYVFMVVTMNLRPMALDDFYGLPLRTTGSKVTKKNVLINNQGKIKMNRTSCSNFSIQRSFVGEYRNSAAGVILFLQPLIRKQLFYLHIHIMELRCLVPFFRFRIYF